MEYRLDVSFYSESGSAFGDTSDAEDSPIWILVLKIIFCSFGLLGNLIVIFVILALKEYKDSVTNWYVLQLAISDLMFLCTIPIKLKERQDNEWPGSEALCKFNESLIFLNYNSSILFLTVMSCDRFLVVCHNTSSLSQTFRKRSVAYITTVIVWAVSLLCCTPIFMYCGVTNHRCACEFVTHKTPEEECIAMGMQDDLENCFDMLMGPTNSGNHVHERSPDELPFDCSYQYESASWIAFIYFNFIALFVVPFIIMAICYSNIVNMMVQSGIRKSSITSTPKPDANKRHKKENKRQLSNSEKAYKKATRLCVAYVVLFAICWLPFHSVHLAKISGIHQTSQFCRSVSAICFVLVIAHSTINPCLYTIVGKTFSGRVRNAFSSVHGKLPGRIHSYSSASGLAIQHQHGKSRECKSHSSTATVTANINQE